MTGDWITRYNGHRPHSSLGYLTPSEYARKRQEQRNSAADLWRWCLRKMGQGQEQRTSNSDPCGKRGKVRSSAPKV